MSNISATVSTRSILKETTPHIEIKEINKGYRTTVETWRWGGTKKLCPKCGHKGLPLVRKQSNKVSKNALGTMCLVSCWPVCFLPFLVAGSDVIYIFCEKCGFFLGTYDRKTGKVKPPCAKDTEEQAKKCSCKSN